MMLIVPLALSKRKPTTPPRASGILPRRRNSIMTETVIQHNAYISRCRRRLHAGRGGQCYNAQSATWVARRSCTSSQETQCYSNHAETNTRTRTAPCAIWMTAAFVARSTCRAANRHHVRLRPGRSPYRRLPAVQRPRRGEGRHGSRASQRRGEPVARGVLRPAGAHILHHAERRRDQAAVADAGLTVIDKGACRTIRKPPSS